MRLKKQNLGVDALSKKFEGMPHLEEDFKFYVHTMAHYAHELGANEGKARRLFAERLSAAPVVRMMSNYADGSQEAKTVFWEIAELCYRYTSLNDIEEGKTHDDGFGRLLDAMNNIRNQPEMVHRLLRLAAKSNGEVAVQKTAGPMARQLDIS